MFTTTADRTSPAYGVGDLGICGTLEKHGQRVRAAGFRWRIVPVSIEEKVIALVGEHLDAPKEEISEKSSFVDDFKADSLDMVELVMALEDEFEVKIPDEDYDKIKTVGDAIHYIKGKQKG
jgi:acyl carrier protein